MLVRHLVKHLHILIKTAKFSFFLYCIIIRFKYNVVFRLVMTVKHLYSWGALSFPVFREGVQSGLRAGQLRSFSSTFINLHGPSCAYRTIVMLEHNWAPVTGKFNATMYKYILYNCVLSIMLQQFGKDPHVVLYAPTFDLVTKWWIK